MRLVPPTSPGGSDRKVISRALVGKLGLETVVYFNHRF
jgi:hypothetical protein